MLHHPSPMQVKDVKQIIVLGWEIKKMALITQQQKEKDILTTQINDDQSNQEIVLTTKKGKSQCQSIYGKQHKGFMKSGMNGMRKLIN